MPSDDVSKADSQCHRYDRTLQYPQISRNPQEQDMWLRRMSFLGSCFHERTRAWLTSPTQIGYGSNKKTRHMMPSGHKAFLVNNPRDVDLLLMHNQTFAAEYVLLNSKKGRLRQVARAGEESQMAD